MTMHMTARSTQKCHRVMHACHELVYVLQVPWDDLRYIFGEIMYGGHIVEDWDRRLANAYLFKYFNETLLEGMEMFPAFFTPANTMTHKQVMWLLAKVRVMLAWTSALMSRADPCESVCILIAVWKGDVTPSVLAIAWFIRSQH